MKATTIICAATVLTLVWTGAAQAHHSGAMFDMTKEIVVNGTVKQWQFVNPHSWLIVEAIGPDGKQQTWSFEGAAPGGGGDSPSSSIRKDTFKPGDKVAVKARPMKDGRFGGALVGVTFSDGRVWTSLKRGTLVRSQP